MVKRYDHHIFLRWLVFRGDENSQRLYLSHHAHWQTGSAHPWQLIEAYRAILLLRLAAKVQQQGTEQTLLASQTFSDQAHEMLLSACEQSFSSGPTVQFIGIVLRSLMVLWGTPWPESSIFFTQIEQKIPALSEKVSLLRQLCADQTVKPSLEPESLEKWFKQFLVFNFR